MIVHRVKRPWLANKIGGYTKTNFDGFYQTTAWRKVRNIFIATNPLCIMCESEGITMPGNVVDHIIPIAKGGDRFKDSNLQTLCYRHHAIKSAMDK